MNFIASFFSISISADWIFQGLQHPLLTPAHIIIIFSLGFLVSQQKETIKHLSILTFAIICGMLGKHFLNINLTVEPILLGIALIMGLLVALRLKKIPRIILFVSLFLTLLAGFLLGLDSSPTRIPGLGSNGILNWHIGSLLSIILSVSILSLIAMALNCIWEGIIIRVMGSWVATSALITLTLQLSKI